MSNNIRAAGPIGVFDSGVGGISVLIELKKQLPNEDFIYFGDCANAPYGIKTKEEVSLLAQNAVELLLKQNVKAIVIACNTATAAAAESLREHHPELPIIGMEPAIKPACAVKLRPRVLVLATPMTLRLEKFKNLEESLSDEADFDLLPCPKLVTIVESGHLDTGEAAEYLTSLLRETALPQPDAVVLGCTHFPFLKKEIRSVFAERPPLFDGTEGTAKQLKKCLAAQGLLNMQVAQGKVIFRSSADDGKIVLMKQLFDKDL